MDSAPVRALRSEMMRRMNDGWHLDGERSDTELRMLHLVPPPLWRIALDALNPVAWFLGATYPTVYRRLRVWVDDQGVVRRESQGDIPSRWPQSYPWDVPDGEVPR